MCLNDVDYGQLAGAVEDIHNLLSIFAEWFEESHKANNLDRSHTRDEITFLWEAAPRYDSLLSAAICDVAGLKDQLNELTDKQIEKLDPLNANTGTVDYSFKVRKYKHGVRFEGEKEGGEISLFDEVAK